MTVIFSCNVNHPRLLVFLRRSIGVGVAKALHGGGDLSSPLSAPLARTFLAKVFISWCIFSFSVCEFISSSSASSVNLYLAMVTL